MPGRATLARWGLPVAAVVGFVWVFPRAQGRTLTVDVDVRRPACVERVAVDVTRDRARARAARITLGAEPRARWEARLPADGYRLRVGLECASGERVQALLRPVDLEDGDLSLPVTVTATCGCAG